MKPGVPDWIMPVPRHGYTGVAIEFKAHGKKPTHDQEDWLETLASERWLAVWTRSDSRAFELVRCYLEGPSPRLAAMVPTVGYFLD
jgi:hypothetical protein